MASGVSHFNVSFIAEEQSLSQSDGVREPQPFEENVKPKREPNQSRPLTNLTARPNGLNASDPIPYSIAFKMHRLNMQLDNGRSM